MRTAFVGSHHQIERRGEKDPVRRYSGEWFWRTGRNGENGVDLLLVRGRGNGIVRSLSNDAPTSVEGRPVVGFWNGEKVAPF